MDLKEALDSIREAPYVQGYKPKQNLHPSAASAKYTTAKNKEVTIGTCLRRQYYDYNDYLVGGPSSARMSRILQLGDIYANLFIEDFKRLGIYVDDEVSFFIPEYGISGRIDCLIKDPYKAPKPFIRPSPSDLIGVEFKTVGGYQGVRGPIISTRDIPLSPKPENVLQVMIYLDYYKKWGLDKWLLFYIDRGLGAGEENPKHYEIHTITLNSNGSPVIQNDSGITVWDYITVEAIYKRYKELAKFLSGKELPPRDFILQYSNTQILELFKSGELNKADTEKVEKYIKKKSKVSDEDPPIIQKGDWQCTYCPFTSICYSDNPAEKPKTKIIAKQIEEVEHFS